MRFAETAEKRLRAHTSPRADVVRGSLLSSLRRLLFYADFLSSSGTGGLPDP